MKLFLPVLSFFLFYETTLQTHKNVSNREIKSKMPVCISYLKTPPPDSLQDFIKVYLQTKGLEVITWADAMGLFQQELQAEMMSWINSGKINGMNDAKAEDLKKSLNPVSNILALSIFNRQDANEFIIDSIIWKVGTMPLKDSNLIVSKLFLPQTNNITNPYSVLKELSNQVVLSGLLK